MNGNCRIWTSLTWQGTSLVPFLLDSFPTGRNWFIFRIIISSSLKLSFFSFLYKLKVGWVANRHFRYRSAFYFRYRFFILRQLCFVLRLTIFYCSLQSRRIRRFLRLGSLQLFVLIICYFVYYKQLKRLGVEAVGHQNYRVNAPLFLLVSY